MSILKITSYLLTLLIICPALAIDIDQKAFYLPNTEIDVQNYSLKLNVETLTEAKDIAASVSIILKANTNLPTLKLHAKKGSIEISEALVNGKSATFKFLNDYVLEIQKPLKANVTTKILLTYKITTAQLMNAEKHGLFFSPTSILSVENWPYHTREWIPSNDSPSDPATFDLKITVPHNIQAVSNGILVGKNKDTFQWKMKQLMPTYGLNLVIGSYKKTKTLLCMDLKEISNNIDLCKSANDLKCPLELYLPSTTNVANAAMTWEKVLTDSRSVAFFSSVLGPYAFDKVGFISAPQHFNMEYPSLITGLGANVHEIAHHWFGNSVFIKHWGDFWISEGFTTYLDDLYQEVYAEVPESRWLTARDGIFNFNEDIDVNTIFDDKPYRTGASSIHALRKALRDTCNVEARSAEDYQIIYAMLRSIYQTFKGKRLGTWELVNHLRSSLEDTLDVNTTCKLSPAIINHMVDEWSSKWYVKY